MSAALVAVELVLESDAPSAEHVLNMLARLQSFTGQNRREIGLTLAEEPRAR